MAQAMGQFAAEKGIESVDPRFYGHLGGTLGGVDSQDRDAPLPEVFQHVTVVAGGLHHQTVAVQRAGLHQVLRAFPEMAHQGRRYRREIGVILVEENLRVHVDVDLHQGTIGAEYQVQIGGVLRLVQFCFGEQAVRQRGFPEGHDVFQAGGATGATGGNAISGFQNEVSLCRESGLTASAGCGPAFRL